MTTLQDIFGQDAAVETLTRAHHADRLHHGLIFAGPAGVGKSTTARALAALFLCENPKSDKPCGKCASCDVMNVLNTDGATNHPDFHVVYRQLIRQEKSDAKARDLSASIIRDYVVEPAGKKPMMNRGKVFVIKEAELMNATAQNSLLKTLEEPPGRALMILLTDQPHALLPTIRSRCQMITFGALDEKVVTRELEKRKIAKTVATEAAELSEGSLGVALRWIEDGVVDIARDLNDQIDAMVGGKPAGNLADFLKKAADAYAEKQIERDGKASKDQATKEGLGLYLKLAATRLRRKLTENADAAQLENICQSIDSIARAENYLDSNVNVALTLQQLAVSLHRDLVGAK